MIEIISAIVVIAALVAIITFMFRGLASPAGAGGGLFAGYGSTGSLSGFGGGLLAAVAASTALANTNAGAGGGASAGALLAVAYFLLTGLRLTIGIRWVSGMVGTFGFVALVVFLIAGTGCAVIPLWQRLLILGLVFVWGALGAVGSLLAARPRIPSMLAVFGALKVAVWLCQRLVAQGGRPDLAHPRWCLLKGCVRQAGWCALPDRVCSIARRTLITSSWSVFVAAASSTSSRIRRITD